MANQEQLRILKKEGVEAWNKWRNSNRDVKVDLRYANLYSADLISANLNNVNLEDAYLTDACLGRSQALGTNFDGATLTGACIEDWNINSETNFENVICEYIYLKKGKQERRPLIMILKEPTLPTLLTK